MSIMKDLFMEEYERISSEAEETGKTLSDDELGRLADEASRDRFADMCDAAKDRAKYQDSPTSITPGHSGNGE